MNRIIESLERLCEDTTTIYNLPPEIEAFLAIDDSTEYTDQIKNNPSSLFETITESQIKQWEEKLISNKDSKLIRSNKPDDKIFSKINKIELKEKQVIKNDSIRTRSREGELIPDFKLTLYQTLTYYCFKAKANYKQGNLLLLQSQSEL